MDYEKVDEIVKDAVEFEFFDKDKLEKYQILTSKRIQEHFIHSTKRRKRVEIKNAKNRSVWLHKLIACEPSLSSYQI